MSISMLFKYVFQNNKLNGSAIIFAANGDRIEFTYEDGVINGKATIKGEHMCYD